MIDKDITPSLTDLKISFCKDGHEGAIVRRWLVDLHMLSILHAWQLWKAITKEPVRGAVYAADRTRLVSGGWIVQSVECENLISDLQELYLIQRNKFEPGYAPEIKAFNFDLETRPRKHAPCESFKSDLCYSFVPGVLLPSLIDAIRRSGKTPDKHFTF